LHVQVNELNNGIEALHKVQEVLKSNLNKADDEVLLIRYWSTLVLTPFFYMQLIVEVWLMECRTVSQYNNLCNKNVVMIVIFASFQFVLPCCI
jgi:hypothetical protein